MTDAIHDFSAKLRQPSLLPAVERYVSWRRSLARARAAGAPPPPAPPAAPISLNLDLTTACNHRCDHCIDWDILNTRQRHHEATLRRSLRTLAARGLRSVILIGGGEPTLHPRFEAIVRFLKGLGLCVAVVSNGSRGERLLAVADALRERDWIRLSLDAGSDARFRELHRPSPRAPGLDEICAWIPRIKARNPRLAVGYSFVVVWQGASRDGLALRENVDEIVSATRRAKRAGCDYIAFKPVLERAPDGAEIMDPERAGGGPAALGARIRRELRRAEALAGDGFRVHVSTNLRVLLQGNWRELTRQPRTCHVQALRQVLTPGGAFNCPAHRGVARARLGGAGAYAGDAAAERTGAALARLLDGFDASRECREVTCLYNAVNWWLEKQIADPREGASLEPGSERRDAFL